MKLVEAVVVFGLLACLPTVLGYCDSHCKSCHFNTCYSCFSGYYYSSLYGYCISDGITDYGTYGSYSSVSYGYHSSEFSPVVFLAVVIPIVIIIIVIATICFCVARRRRMRNRLAASSGAKIIGSSSFSSPSPITDQSVVQDLMSVQHSQIVQGSPLYPDPYAMQMQQQPIFMNPQPQPMMYMNQQQPQIYGAHVY